MSEGDKPVLMGGDYKLRDSAHVENCPKCGGTCEGNKHPLPIWCRDPACPLSVRQQRQHLPPAGDRGQRYEHWCDDGDGKPFRLGWSNHPTKGFADMVAKHPVYKNHRSIDRQPGGGA